MRSNIGCEASRLQFMEQRDGVIGARAFAQQSLKQYRRALHTGYGREFRTQLIHSCWDFRYYIQTNGTIHKGY